MDRMTVVRRASFVVLAAMVVACTGAPATPTSPSGAGSSLTLTAGQLLACTRAACPTIAFESAYTTILAGDHLVTLTGDTLALASPRGSLAFLR
jgi:hypothetical protein